MRVLAAASLQVTARQRDNVKMAVHSDYTKVLQKKSDNPEWLFGRDLMETAQQCDLSQKLTDKIQIVLYCKIVAGSDHSSGDHDGSQQCDEEIAACADLMENIQKKMYGQAKASIR